MDDLWRGLAAAGVGAVIGAIAQAFAAGWSSRRREVDKRLRELEDDVSRIKGRFDGGSRPRR